MLILTKGDADTWTETVTGLSSLSGYSAKAYVYTTGGTLVDTFTGTVSGMTITYDIKNEDTKTWATGKHNVFTKIWDTSDHVYSPFKDKIVVLNSDVVDPS
jgi:hypothetical protein